MINLVKMLNADIFEKVSTEEKSHVAEPEMGSAFERYHTKIYYVTNQKFVINKKKFFKKRKRDPIVQI